MSVHEEVAQRIKDNQCQCTPLGSVSAVVDRMRAWADVNLVLASDYLTDEDWRQLARAAVGKET